MHIGIYAQNLTPVKTIITTRAPAGAKNNNTMSMISTIYPRFIVWRIKKVVPFLKLRQVVREGFKIKLSLLV